MREIIPFAKEIMSQKPSRGMVKVYAVGTVLAFFGLVIGLVETVCHIFTTERPIDDEELARLRAREHRLQLEVELSQLSETPATAEARVVSKQRVTVMQRNSANRLHAS